MGVLPTITIAENMLIYISTVIASKVIIFTFTLNYLIYKTNEPILLLLLKRGLHHMTIKKTINKTI